MRKLFIFMLSLWCVVAFAQFPPPINVTEEDGDPSVYPYKIEFQNDSVTDNGDSTVTIEVPSLTALASTVSGSAGCTLIGIPSISTPTWTKQCDFNSLFGSVGRASGGIITDAGSETVNVSAGTGFIKATDSDTAELLSFDWQASNGISVPTDERRYIGVIYNSGTPIVDSRATDNYDLDTEFPLGSVINENGTLHILQNPWWITDGTTNIIEAIRSLGNIRRDEFVGGLSLSVTGTRNIAVTTGTVWSHLNEFVIPAIDTSVTGAVEYYWYNGVAGTWNSSDVSQYSVTQWNDITLSALQTLNNNWYANIWVYVEADDTEVSLLYPQAQYPVVVQAENESSPALVPDHIKEHGILIGRILIKQGTDTPIEVQSAFDTMFSTTQASDHGNLTGLSDDDHAQYWIAGSSRTGNFSTSGSVQGEQITSTDDITLAGVLTNTPGASDITAYDLNQSYSGSSSIESHDIDVTVSGTGITDSRTNYVYNVNFDNTQQMSLTSAARSINNYGMAFDIDSTGSHNTGTSFGSSEYLYGLLMSTYIGSKTISGTYGMSIYSIGALYNAYANNIVNATANAMGITAIGFNADVQTYGNTNTGGGTINAVSKGINISLNGQTGQTGVTNTGYGVYVASVSGYDYPWGYYNATSAHNLLGGDNIKSYFGWGNDASIYFDRYDLIVNSENVTSNDEIHFQNFSLYSFDGDISTTGNVTGANLNISNWDTAYGWGDHAGLYEPVNTKANKALNNLDSVAINTSLLSDTDNTDDLGSGGAGTKRWKDLYLAGNITDNTNTVTVANLKTAYDHSQDNTQAHSDYLLNTGDTATGDYNFGSGVFFIDDTNNRVGIGTTTPNVMIEIYNSSAIATFRVNNGVSTAGYGGSQLQFFASASPGGTDDKNFAINNANSWTSGGENFINIQARKDDGTWKQDLLILTQDNGYFYLPKVYSHDVGSVRDLLIKSDGQLGYNSSSIKYKENVKDYVDSSDIYKLRPVEYDRKDGSTINEKGLIAEEVELADVDIPNLVSYKRGERIIDTGKKDEFGEPITRIEYYDTDEPETVNYSRLIVPLLREVQRLNERVKALEVTR